MHTLTTEQPDKQAATQQIMRQMSQLDTASAGRQTERPRRWIFLNWFGQCHQGWDICLKSAHAQRLDKNSVARRECFFLTVLYSNRTESNMVTFQATFQHPLKTRLLMATLDDVVKVKIFVLLAETD